MTVRVMYAQTAPQCTLCLVGVAAPAAVTTKQPNNNHCRFNFISRWNRHARKCPYTLHLKSKKFSESLQAVSLLVKMNIDSFLSPLLSPSAGQRCGALTGLCTPRKFFKSLGKELFSLSTYGDGHRSAAARRQEIKVMTQICSFDKTGNQSTDTDLQHLEDRKSK